MLRIVFTLAPVSGTGTGFGPLPSREMGIWWLVCLVVSPARPSGLRIKSAMTVLPRAVVSCPRGNDGPGRASVGFQNQDHRFAMS